MVAVEVVNLSRKHTDNVCESVADIRGIFARLVKTRDERRDGFVQVVKKAMETRLGFRDFGTEKTRARRRRFTDGRAERAVLQNLNKYTVKNCRTITC